jgi:hypothetical protein
MATKRTRDSDHGRRLLGSERPRPTSHAHVKPLADDEQVAFNFVVRRRPGAPKLPDMAHWQSVPLRERKFLTPEDYVATFGARQADIDAIAILPAATD